MKIPPLQDKNSSKTYLSKREKVALFVSLFIIILLIALTFPKNRYIEYDYEIGEITKKTIIAPFYFPILKTDDELKHDREEALIKVPLVFIQNEEMPRKEMDRLKSFFDNVERLRKSKKKFEDSKILRERYRYSNRYNEIYSISKTDSATYTNLAAEFQQEFKFDINSITMETLLNTSGDILPEFTKPARLLPKLRRILTDIYAHLVIDIPKKEIISEKIAIQQNGEELIESPDQVLDLEEAWTKAKLDLQAIFPGYGSKVINVEYDILVNFIKPNLIFQKEITESRQKDARDKVPLGKGIVRENEKIIDSNTRVTPEIYKKLESLSKERIRRINIQGGWRTNFPIVGDPIIFLGQIALVGIIFISFLAFLVSYRPEIFKNLKMIILVGIIFILLTGIATLFVNKLKISEYSVPIVIAAMLFTILFDSRIAFAGTITLSVLIGAQLSEITFIVVSIFVGSFAIISVQKLRKRSQMFQSIIFIVIAYFISISVTETLKFAQFSATLKNHFLFSGINAIVSPFLAYGIIGLLESIFGITTDLTLLELSDFNHPLLKLLSKEATGTFTHSVTVGNLAEAGADAIGANSLLARVGAYYHDIGKITKPEYFVENQSYDDNKHDNLAPNLSALIIINHVKEGMRLASEYKLPQVITEFIPTHHGTTRIEYFHKKALEQTDNLSEINESDFHYPGPKPKTKETGIVMICEAIEAAARSMDNPTPGNIERTVDNITKSRLKEGELDECPLTMDDLRKIKGDIRENYGILPVLRGIFHVRIEYPEQQIPEKAEPSHTKTNK